MMRHFGVLINGVNFLISGVNKPEWMGFFVTVYVDTTTPKAAEYKAIAFLRKDKSLLQVTKNKRSDPPLMYVKEVSERTGLERKIPSRNGFVFYHEKSKK